METSTKTCRKCGETKPTSAFVRRGPAELLRLKAESRENPYYVVGAQCKVCRYEYMAKWRSARGDEYRAKKAARYSTRIQSLSPEALKAYRMQRRESHKATRSALRAKVYAAYGAICSCCGETVPEFLTLDHVNNDGAKHRQSLTGSSKKQGYKFLLWIVANKYPNSIQVLCWNCQWGKVKNNGVCPHQSVRSAYTTVKTGLSLVAH